ncbi:transposase [archaeon]|nr:MAG: transposase [archaeon]
MRSHHSNCLARVSNAPVGAARRCVSWVLFVAGDGSVVNADVNAAYNIIRKAFPDALAKGIEDASLHPACMPLGTACECT